MSAPVRIKDGGGSNSFGLVSSIGQQITRPFDYDRTAFNKIDIVDTAFNFYGAEPRKQFVITGMRIKADRFVSVTVDADIIIYEAESDITTTVDRILHEEPLVSGESATLFPMNLLVNQGKFINAKSSDVDIFITITGHFIPELT